MGFPVEHQPGERQVVTTDWDAYARSHLQDESSFAAEPVQHQRSMVIGHRARGRVLDVGGGDAYQARLMREAGAEVTVLDISKLRCQRAADAGFESVVGDARGLPYPDDSFDTVVIGEVLEHLDEPGAAWAEAFRVARDRVVVSLPLQGWIDPTHKWRVCLDVCIDPVQDAQDVTRGRQIVLTFDRGDCWPDNYWAHDARWDELFGDAA